MNSSILQLLFTELWFGFKEITIKEKANNSQNLNKWMSNVVFENETKKVIRNVLKMKNCNFKVKNPLGNKMKIVYSFVLNWTKDDK